MADFTFGRHVTEGLGRGLLIHQVWGLTSPPPGLGMFPCIESSCGDRVECANFRVSLPGPAAPPQRWWGRSATGGPSGRTSVCCQRSSAAGCSRRCGGWLLLLQRLAAAWVLAVRRRHLV